MKRKRFDCFSGSLKKNAIEILQPCRKKPDNKGNFKIKLFAKNRSEETGTKCLFVLKKERYFLESIQLEKENKNLKRDIGF